MLGIQQSQQSKTRLNFHQSIYLAYPSLYMWRPTFRAVSRRLSENRLTRPQPRRTPFGRSWCVEQFGTTFGRTRMVSTYSTNHNGGRPGSARPIAKRTGLPPEPNEQPLPTNLRAIRPTILQRSGFEFSPKNDEGRFVRSHGFEHSVRHLVN